MGAIPFTQYMLPDGRTKPVAITRPDEISQKARAIIEAGYRFECEVLTTGMVSVTIFDPDEEDDVNIRVTPNGPEVPSAIDDMINETSAMLATREKPDG